MSLLTDSADLVCNVDLAPLLIGASVSVLIVLVILVILVVLGLAAVLSN